MYSYVDLDNYHAMLKEVKISEDEVIMKRLNEDKEKAKNAMLEHFSCKEKDLRKREYDIDDPCFYLKRKLNSKIRFSNLLNRYPISNEKDSQAYSFFSLFIHPRCELDPKSEEGIMSLRIPQIDNVMALVYGFLKDEGMLIGDEDFKEISEFDEDFFDNPLLKNNVENINVAIQVFDSLNNKFSYLKGGIDYFNAHFIKVCSSMMVDMLISESLGYKEHVISVFKSFIEHYAVFFAVGCAENQNEFEAIKSGYWLSSRLQIDDYLKKTGDINDTVNRDVLNSIYENYYKEKYGLDDFNKFCQNMKNNSLYFLTNEKKSYNKYVSKLVREAIPDEKQAIDLFSVYRVAKDIGHASGYGFNASEAIIDFNCHKAILYTSRLMCYYILNASLVLEDHGEPRDSKVELLFFKAIMEVENKAINDLYGIYEQKIEGDNEK